MKTQKPRQPLALGIQPAPNIMLHMQLLQEALNHSDWIKLSAIENWHASVKGFRHWPGSKTPTRQLTPANYPTTHRLTPPVHPAALAPTQPPFQTVPHPRRRDALIPSPPLYQFRRQAAIRLTLSSDIRFWSRIAS